MPPDIINKINKLIYGFIWKSTERIKRNTLIGPIDKGGVNMVNVENHFLTLKATWVKKLLDSEETWSYLGRTYIEEYGDRNILLHTNNVDNKYLKKLTEFYQQVLYSFIKINNVMSNEPSNQQEILNSVIWDNTNITVKTGRNTTPIYFKNWIECGILFVKDLKLSNGRIDENFCFKKIRKKQNILAQTLQLKKALSRYSELLKSINENSITESIPMPTTLKNTAKRNNQLLNEKNFVKPKFSLIKQYIPDISEAKICEILTKRVRKEKDKRLAEFYYKLLTDNLICAKVLSKWNEEIPERCIICDELDDVSHMIFECQLAKEIWQILEDKLEEQFRVKDIITSEYLNDNNKILTYTSFFIFKFWIETTNKRNVKSKENIKFFIKKNFLCQSGIELEQKNNRASYIFKRISDTI